jgi:hypothetical protein
MHHLTMLPQPIVIRIKKLDAAKRQLDSAIRAFFNDEDSIAVHTLVGAASNIASDLVKCHASHNSWDKTIAHDNKLDINKYFQIVRQPQNFFKHADKDSDGEIEFNKRDTEHLLWVASLNLGEINSAEQMHSDALSVFQLWYIAVWKDLWGNSVDNDMDEIIRQAQELFPGITALSREEQLYLGREALWEAKWLLQGSAEAKDAMKK